jgi:FkbM family methyltransferase
MRFSHFLRLFGRFGITVTRSQNVDPGLRLAIARQHILSKLEISRILDIGANRGQWATETFKGGYSGEIFSFEPTRAAFQALESITSLNKNWTALNVAVGSHEGTEVINISANEELSSSFLEMGYEHSLAAPHSEFISSEEVKVITIDNYIPGASRVFLKIDTQGYEFEILKSIEDKSWESIDALEIEVSFVPAYVNGVFAEDVINFLRARNFRPYRLENGLARTGFGQIIQADILFVKEVYAASLN